MFTTLEPCSIYNLTPPCTKAIIDAQIKEVHAAALDPNPKVNGRGRSALEAAGIDTYVGQESKDAGILYEGFSKKIRTGIPFVISKFAVSLDGKMATHAGNSQWITGEIARSFAQGLRRTSDAIIIGLNTLILDDPRLTARATDDMPYQRQPVRIILDSHCRTPVEARVFKEPGHVIIATTCALPEKTSVLESVGAEILLLPSHNGLVDLETLLKRLGKRDIVTVLVEGGGKLQGSFFDRHSVDKIMAFIAPIIIGGEGAPSPVEGAGAKHLVDALDLRNVNIELLGRDLLVTGYPHPGN